MAYDREKIFEIAKKAIVDKKLVFIEEIVSFLPITKPTFYEYYKVDSNEFNELKELIELNKVDAKIQMRSKWFDSEAPALQMGLMKLLSTDEELRKLSMSVQSHEGSVGVVWNESKTYTDDTKQEADNSN